MIDIHAETLISFGEASASLPGRPNLSTLHRWRVKGIRSVKLESCLYGGRRMTSAEALQRFVNRSTAAADGTPVPTRTPKKRQRDIEKAEAELRAAGV